MEQRCRCCGRRKALKLRDLRSLAARATVATLGISQSTSGGRAAHGVVADGHDLSHWSSRPNEAWWGSCSCLVLAHAQRTADSYQKSKTLPQRAQ